MEFEDQLGRKLRINSTPKRIVSLVPSQTELLFDLGLSDSIVGITKFCVHPSHLRSSKTVVGGTKNVKAERIKALRPDIILCNKEENSLELVDQMENIAPVHISDIYTIDDCIRLLIQYGQLFDATEKAEVISLQIKKLRQDFIAFTQDHTKLKVAYFIWKDPWMVAAKQTFIDHMLAINNFENVFGNLERYPEIKLDSEVLKKADLIMLSSEPFPFKEEHLDQLRQLCPLAKVLLVNGEYFSWYGSRLIHAFDYFRALRQAVL